MRKFLLITLTITLLFLSSCESIVNIIDPSEYIVPSGNTIYNNGGSLIQYGDCIYYFDPMGNIKWYSEEWYNIENELNVMKEDGSKKYKLLSIRTPKQLFAIEGFIITSGYMGVSEVECIYKISIETGEITNLCEGSLNYVDTEKEEVYFTYNNYDDEDTKSGFYKIDADGKSPIKLCPSGYGFLAKIGDLIYLNSPQDGKSYEAVLSSVNTQSYELKKIASIPTETDGEKENIVDFGICDNWIILSVGNFQGSARIFYGKLVRLRLDGSDLEELYSGISSFEILDDWIYLNNWSINSTEDKIRYFRIHPDLTEKTYFSNEANWMYTLIGNNIYYNSQKVHGENAKGNLNQCNSDGSDILVLYDGNNAPSYEDSGSISYENIELVGKYVYFNLVVYGYVETDTWRGHTCYYGYYRVCKDGSNLELLYEIINH